MTTGRINQIARERDKRLEAQGSQTRFKFRGVILFNFFFFNSADSFPSPFNKFVRVRTCPSHGKWSPTRHDTTCSHLGTLKWNAVRRTGSRTRRTALPTDTSREEPQ